MNFKELRRIINKNNYEEIVEYIDAKGDRDCAYEFRDAASVAVNLTKNGHEGHSVRALMDRGFSFVSIDYGFNRYGIPNCALTELCKFAIRAKSRKEEAIGLLREVYKYEIPRNEFVPEEIIPVTHPDMIKLRRSIEWQLALYGQPAKRNDRKLVCS